MDRYFDFYYRRLVAGAVLAGIMLAIHIIAEVVKWIVLFIQG